MLYQEDGSDRTIEIPARRQFTLGAALVIGALCAEGSRAQDKAQQAPLPATPEARCRRTSLHQEIDFNASSGRIYEALLDSKRFTAFSGAPAQIDRSAGGAFSLFGGLIGGRNIELVPNERIVQAWRPADWTPGVYSLVRFEIVTRGPHTQLVLDHTGFPEGGFEHLNSGWKSHYWDALAKYLV
jgi:activator of HSP90 ATPase